MISFIWTYKYICLVCRSDNCSYNYCSHWHACVACLNWLAILLGSEAEQSSGRANLLSILSVSCTGFAVLTELCVVDATQLLKENQIAIIYLLENFLLQFAQILNGVQNHWSISLPDCHTCLRHIIIKLYLLSASSSMEFHCHLLMAVTATLQILPQYPHRVSY